MTNSLHNLYKESLPPGNVSNAAEYYVAPSGVYTHRT